jgi:hypothetical protein
VSREPSPESRGGRHRATQPKRCRPGAFRPGCLRREEMQLSAGGINHLSARGVKARGEKSRSTEEAFFYQAPASSRDPAHSASPAASVQPSRQPGRKVSETPSALPSSAAPGLWRSRSGAEAPERKSRSVPVRERPPPQSRAYPIRGSPLRRAAPWPISAHHDDGGRAGNPLHSGRAGRRYPAGPPRNTRPPTAAVGLRGSRRA